MEAEAQAPDLEGVAIEIIEGHVGQKLEGGTLKHHSTSAYNCNRSVSGP